MNVVLVGFRCTGKSCVGQLLAERMGLGFADSDLLIEQETEQSIRKIFSKRGESWFRAHETRVIARLAKRDNLVISTGGGAVLRYKNVQNLRRNGRIFLLEADKETVHQRIVEDIKRSNGRPPLTGNDSAQEIGHLMSQRKPYYRKAADFVLDTRGKSVEEIVEVILQKLGWNEEFAEPPGIDQDFF